MIDKTVKLRLKFIYMRLTAILPAHNEGANIREVILGIEQYVDNIIVVDDGSKDNTYFAAKESSPSVVVLRHKINLGKGAALKTGCEAALKLGSEIIALMDADGQHAPEDIIKMAEKLEKENLDIIFGVRLMNEKMPLLTRWGNRLLTKIINFLSGISLSDTQSGLKVFRASIYPKIGWQANDYSVETEIMLKVGENKLRYSQFPIQTIYKDVYRGMDIFDGVKYFLNFLKQKFL